MAESEPKPDIGRQPLLRWMGLNHSKTCYTWSVIRGLGYASRQWCRRPRAARTMMSKSQFVLVFLLTSWGFALELKAQSPMYRSVNSADLLGGYIPNGEWIEATGHVWFSDKGVFFNFNLPSARVPMLVDVANVDPENIRRLKSTCGSPDQFSGGCRATIRGQVGRLDHRQDILMQDQGILARDIQIIPRQ
jgi:hypothetical protein